jgi:isopentenyldiphosphate isomerase
MLVKVKINNPIGNLYKKNYVLVLIKQGKKFILSKKKHLYPNNYARMIGGSVAETETPKDAIIRIIDRDLALEINNIDYISSLKSVVNSAQGEVIVTTYIYYIDIETKLKLKMLNQNKSVEYFTEKELERLILSMADLKEIEEDDQELFNFDWNEYRKIYEPIHQIAYEYARKKNY